MTPAMMKTGVRSNEAPAAATPDLGCSRNASRPATGKATKRASNEPQKTHLKNHSSLNLTSATTSVAQINTATEVITASYLTRRFMELTRGLSGAGPRVLECKQDGPSRVHSRPIVMRHFRASLLDAEG